jgi:ABC-type multidrug transport system ATPase subunit
MLNKVWQQPNPHEWQMKGIHKPFDAGTLMALHVPPDSGKTTVMRGVVTLLHGISIIIMPTLALAGNQVSKTLSFKVNKADKNILHVIHLDDARRQNSI